MDEHVSHPPLAASASSFASVNGDGDGDKRLPRTPWIGLPAQRCLAELQAQFGPPIDKSGSERTPHTDITSLRVWRLEALFMEAQGHTDAAMALYDRMYHRIKKAAARTTPTAPAQPGGTGPSAASSSTADASSIPSMAAFISRRRASLQRAQRKTRAAISTLVEHVSLYSADVEAYEELCDLYLAEASTTNHTTIATNGGNGGGDALSLAAHCMEEVLLHNPHNHLNHTKYADIMYTLDKTENARKHYSRALELTQTPSTRALYGLLLCTVSPPDTAAETTPSRNKGKKKATDKDKRETQCDRTVANELALEAKRQLMQKYRAVDSQQAVQLAQVAENTVSALMSV